MNSLYEKIKFYNDRIEEKARYKDKKSFEIIKGEFPIILSAPHCVNQIREGKLKGAEGETGAIVQLLAEKMNCYAIYKTYTNNDDANYDIEKNPYKDEIVKLIKEENIKLLIDFHGSNYNSPFDVEIGTGKGKNIQFKYELVDLLKKCLERSDIPNIVVDKKFLAISEHTISRSISKKSNIPCIQLEINGRYRYIEHLDGIAKFINGMIEFINTYKERITK